MPSKLSDLLTPRLAGVLLIAALGGDASGVNAQTKTATTAVAGGPRLTNAGPQGPKSAAPARPAPSVQSAKQPSKTATPDATVLQNRLKGLLVRLESGSAEGSGAEVASAISKLVTDELKAVQGRQAAITQRIADSDRRLAQLKAAHDSLNARRIVIVEESKALQTYAQKLKQLLDEVGHK